MKRCWVYCFLLMLMILGEVSKVSGAYPPPLKVAGNKLVDSNGKTVILRGVNRSGTEFACVQPGNLIFNGPNDQSSIDAMKAWHINAVRVPLNEDCWLGINGAPIGHTAAQYVQQVTAYLDLLASNGLYVIIDLHWTNAGSNLASAQQPMPNTDHSIDFWTAVASALKGKDYIIFDLFNEPYPSSNTFDSTAAWQCWRDGGSKCEGLSFTAAGLQDLVDAVRSADATNVIMLGGIAYSNSLVQWTTYVPNDPLKNIAAAWHSYNFNYCASQTCWEQYIKPVAQKYPVVAGEFGENDCAHGYADQLMTYLDALGISYLGWTWNNWDCSSGPSLVGDFSGTATNYGLGLKNHLAALAAATVTSGSSTSSSGATSSSATTASSSTSTTGVASSTTGTSGSSSGCDATAIKITQIAGSSWPQGGATITQYAVTVATTCTTKKLVALTVTVSSNWAPYGFWGATASGSTLSFPSYAVITPSSPYTGMGYPSSSPRDP